MTSKSRNLSIFRTPLVFALALSFASTTLLGSCKKENVSPSNAKDTVETIDSKAVNTTKIYIPNELKENDFYKSSSKWYYGRSKQSEHFIVFWSPEYGKNDPNSDKVAEAYRVNIDDLLSKAEAYYNMNVNTLKFAETGSSKSNLDKYKMMIFVLYQTDWLATGSGYDDVIGALWVSPSTCHPVGSVIAHEIGHTFQYQVFCDLKGDHGFRYGFGGNGGNAFWEQTAQWQSFQSYPEEVFTNYNFTDYTKNYFRHICHEEYRYGSYFIHYYWTYKHGLDFIGKLWRSALKPEDPVQAYMRINSISFDEMNSELYDAAARFVTWDIPALKELGANSIGAQTYKMDRQNDGSYMVAYDHCPGTTGYNVIPLNVPDAGTVVSTSFTGCVNAAGFNQVADPSRAGWRYGYVALLSNGTRVYGTMNRSNSGTATFTVPQSCSKLWLVVTGAPTTYLPHAWDDKYDNDDQWPYKVKFTNTDLLGNISFDGTETPQNVSLTYNVSFAASATEYTGKSISLGSDFTKVAKAFVLQPSAINSAVGSTVKFYGVEPNGSLFEKTTANGYGHWFNAAGNAIAWGADAKVYSEFSPTTDSFTFGQYPGHCKSGDKFTVKQALVYEYQTGKTVQATFTFNITIE